MKSRLISCLGIFCGLVLSLICVTPAAAISINTNTVACQPVGAPSTDVRHVENGTYTEGTVSGPRMVTCAIPRSPLALPTSGTFYFTGDNRDGTAATTCTLNVYDFTGVFITSSSFTTSLPHWSQIVTVPNAQLPYWSYTSVTCSLPAGARGDVESAVAVSLASPLTNINMNATECQTNGWPQDAIVHTDRGILTAPTTAADTWVSCTVPRTPLATGITTGVFYIDGDNFNGASTVCSLASYNYTGQFLGSNGFISSGASYDFFLTLPAEQLSYWAYTGITCVLPSHGNGVLRGLTSVQGS